MLFTLACKSAHTHDLHCSAANGNDVLGKTKSNDLCCHGDCDKPMFDEKCSQLNQVHNKQL